MTKTTYTLGHHEGRLCVITSEPNWAEPTLTHLYWPIENQRLDDWQEYVGAELMHGWSDEPFYLALSPTVRPYSFARSCHFTLTEGGRTKPIHIEHEPIPKPRTRCECYWHQGHWMKRTARGTVPA